MIDRPERDAALRMHQVQFERANRLEADRDATRAALAALRARIRESCDIAVARAVARGLDEYPMVPVAFLRAALIAPAPANESQTAEGLHSAAENETPPAGEIKVCYACYEGDCEYDDCPTWCQCDHNPASDDAVPAEETR